MRDILVTEPTGRVLDDADYSRLLNEHANADRGGRKGVEPVSDACDAGRSLRSRGLGRSSLSVWMRNGPVSTLPPLTGLTLC